MQWNICYPQELTPLLRQQGEFLRIGVFCYISFLGTQP